MIYITNQAKQELSKLYSAKEPEPDDYLRLTDHGHDQLGIDLGHKQADDESLELNAQVTLMFEADLVADGRDVSLDAYETPDGPRLVVSREEMLQSHHTVTVNWIQLPLIPCVNN